MSSADLSRFAAGDVVAIRGRGKFGLGSCDRFVLKS
jgi:hypothetical protein